MPVWRLHGRPRRIPMSSPLLSLVSVTTPLRGNPPSRDVAHPVALAARRSALLGSVRRGSLIEQLAEELEADGNVPEMKKPPADQGPQTGTGGKCRTRRVPSWNLTRWADRPPTAGRSISSRSGRRSSFARMDRVSPLRMSAFSGEPAIFSGMVAIRHGGTVRRLAPGRVAYAVSTGR